MDSRGFSNDLIAISISEEVHIPAQFETTIGVEQAPPVSEATGIVAPRILQVDPGCPGSVPGSQVSIGLLSAGSRELDSEALNGLPADGLGIEAIIEIDTAGQGRNRDLGREVKGKGCGKDGKQGLIGLHELGLICLYKTRTRYAFT